MRCYNCKQNIPDNFAVCPYCGSEQINPEYIKKQTQKFAHTYTWILTLILLIFTLFLGVHLCENMFVIDDFMNITSLKKEENVELSLQEYLENKDVTGYVNTFDDNYDLLMNNKYNEYVVINQICRRYKSIQISLMGIKENKKMEYYDFYAIFSEAMLHINDEFEYYKQTDATLNNQVQSLMDSLPIYISNVLGCEREQAQELLNCEQSAEIILRLNSLLNKESFNE